MYGHYEFLVMSSSLTNAPVAFMDLIVWVFQNYIDSFFIVFIDDILVYLNIKGVHMGFLRVVLKTLSTLQ